MRETDIQADRRSRSKLLIASENPFCSAPGIQRAELAESLRSRKARQTRSYANACGYTLTSCNWSKSYTQKTRKRDMIFAGISKRSWKMMMTSGKDHFQWWGDLPLKWKGQQVQCEDMGEWISACHSGGWTRLSKTQCVLCRIKADCVRPVHLWGTNRYWPKVPGKANWLIPQLAAERHDCLFQQDGGRRTGILLSARFSTSTCQTDGLAVLDKMTRCSANGPRDHRTWPLVTFSFGGTRRSESMYLHHPQPWMSCRNASLQLSSRSRRICCRQSGPS